MKRIIVLSFKDGNVTEGLRRLIALHPDAVVVLPVMGLSTFTSSAMEAIRETKAKYHLFFTDSTENIDGLILGAHDITMCANPMKEVLREITADDILAMVWDESIEAHMTLHAVEDLAVETWNIEDGLDVIEVDYDDDSESDLLYAEMQEKLSDFIESFSEYIMNGVLDVLTKAVQERLAEEAGKREINPFEDQ